MNKINELSKACLNKVRIYIKENELEQALNQLESCLNDSFPNEKKAKNIFIILKNDFNKLKMTEIIDIAEKYERKRIIWRLLNLLDWLEEPSSTKTITENIFSILSFSNLIFIVMGIIIFITTLKII